MASRCTICTATRGAPTCRTIEAYAQEAVQTGFARELNGGLITWEVINYESPGNEHYATDYQVIAPNVVLAKFEEGKQVAWKGPPEVWEHVGDKAAFLSFVQTNLREFVGVPPATSRRACLDASSDRVPRPVPSDSRVVSYAALTMGIRLGDCNLGLPQAPEFVVISYHTKGVLK